MSAKEFFDKAGEVVVMIWCDGFESRDWGIATRFKKPFGRAFLGVAGVLFGAADKP